MKMALRSLLILAFALTATARAQEKFGVMVMAHGGGNEWNAGVLETVAPLQERYALEVAFGMADAVSLQAAVDKLEAQGVSHIAVVRLFISGESWHERTRQMLGLLEGAPERPAGAGHHAGAIAEQGHGESVQEGEISGHGMEFWRLSSAATFAVSSEGLAEAAESGEALLDRVATLSREPANEDILILAHGPQDDAEDARWIAYMEEHVKPLREQGNFHSIRVATLREDWPDKREAAEREIRAYVQAANESNRTAIVIPFRVYGFGPYADLLEGLDYVADGKGLIPHEAITRWIARQAEGLR